MNRCGVRLITNGEKGEEEHGGEKKGDRKESREENFGGKEEKEEQIAPKAFMVMDMLIVQLPRGRTAVVQWHAEIGRVTTNHPGLRVTMLRNGVRDLSGKLVLPHAGREFLSALYDALFLSGYQVRWCQTVGESDCLAASPE